MFLEKLGKEIERHHLTGTFKLSSGRDTTDYYNLAPILLNSQYLAGVANKIRIMTSDLWIDSVGCVEMCPIPLVGAILVLWRAPWGFIVRKQSKGHGTDVMIEGTVGQRVLLVEDVTSTGLSVYRAAKAIENAGSQVATIVTIVNRQEGCDGLLAEYDFRSLFTRQSLEELLKTT